MTFCSKWPPLTIYIYSVFDLRNLKKKRLSNAHPHQPLVSRPPSGEIS